MTKQERQIIASIKRVSREIQKTRQDREDRRFQRQLARGKNPKSFKL